MSNTYTKYQRREIAKVFKNAQEWLWNGVDNTKILDNKYICSVIALLYENKIAGIRAREIIMGRLSPNTTVKIWLKAQAGIPVEELTPERLQQHRLEWLEILHKEFSTNK